MLIEYGKKKDGKKSKNDNQVDSFIWHLRVLKSVFSGLKSAVCIFTD